MNRTAVLALCLSLFAAATGAALNLPLKAAAADPNSQASLLKECQDSALTWNLGFAALSLDGVSAGSLSLAEALPRLWKQAYSISLQHVLDDHTRLLIAQEIHRNLLNKAKEALSQAVLDRDTAWLQDRATAASELQSRTRITEAEKRVAALQELEPVQIPIAAGKPITIVNADDELFPAVPPGEKPPLALKQKLQGLVYGSLGEEQGYLILRLAVWDWLQDKLVWQDDWVIDPKTAQDRIGDQLEAMSVAVLGQAFAGMELSVQPKEALVTVLGKAPAKTASAASTPAPGTSATAAIPLTVDGQAILGQEPGGGVYHFLPPGEYEVELALDGYQTMTEKITLSAGENKTLSWELTKRDIQFFVLDSQPSAARIYYDNRYFGLTPAEVPIPDARTTVSLEKEGYRSTRLVVPTNPPASQTVAMLKDLINWKDETKLRRNQLFDSLAGLGLSILPPLFFSALHNNLVSTIPKTWTASSAISVADYDRLSKDANTFNSLMIGSLVATAAMAVNMGINLGAYLTAADLASGR